MDYFIVVCPWKYVCDFETAVRLSLQACDQTFNVSTKSPLTIMRFLYGKHVELKVSSAREIDID